MLCEKCGKYAATTHIHTVVNGAVKEQYLCELCAAAEGYATASQNSLSSMLASMFSDVLAGEKRTLKRCSVCGSSFEDIAKSGKAGCSDCYKTFKEEFLPYLKRLHGSTKHIGKRPMQSETKTDAVKKLRLELERLIEGENYEQAAVVRDKIRELEAADNE